MCFKSTPCTMYYIPAANIGWVVVGLECGKQLIQVVLGTARPGWSATKRADNPTTSCGAVHRLSFTTKTSRAENWIFH